MNDFGVIVIFIDSILSRRMCRRAMHRDWSTRDAQWPLDIKGTQIHKCISFTNSKVFCCL